MVTIVVMVVMVKKAQTLTGFTRDSCFGALGCLVTTLVWVEVIASIRRPRNKTKWRIFTAVSRLQQRRLLHPLAFVVVRARYNIGFFPVI